MLGAITEEEKTRQSLVRWKTELDNQLKEEEFALFMLTDKLFDLKVKVDFYNYINDADYLEEQNAAIRNYKETEDEYKKHISEKELKQKLLSRVEETLGSL